MTLPTSDASSGTSPAGASTRDGDGAAGAMARRIVDALDDLILCIGFDGVFGDARQAPGPERPPTIIPPDQFVGRAMYDVLPGPLADLLAASLARLAREGGSETLEYAAHDPRGLRHFRTRITRVDGLGDGPPFAVICVRDVTEERHFHHELLASEARFRRLFERHNAILMQVDPHSGAIVDANDAAAAFYGYSRERLRAMNIGDINLLAPDEVARNRSEALAEQKNEFVFPHRLAHGEVRMMEVRSTPIETPSGPVLFSILTDVTARHHAERELRQAATVFDSSPDGIVVTDAQLRVVQVNQGFTAITGFAPERVQGEHLASLLRDPDDEHALEPVVFGVRHADQWQGELRGVRADGSRFPHWFSLTAVRAPDGSIANHVAIVRDISALRDAQARLESRALIDELTQLPNRAGIERQLDARTDPCAAILLAVIGIDRFRFVNDGLGHATGDRLLRAFARHLLETSDPEEIVGRLSGDEFVVVTSATDDPVAFATSLFRRVEAPLLVDGMEWMPGASIGIASSEGALDRLHLPLARAESALAAAKRAGRGTWRLWEERLDTGARRRYQLEQALRRAIHENEFDLAWQPIVNSADGVVLGVEVLARWSPSRGESVSPAEFIPVAEEAGLIGRLGDIIADLAFTRWASWQAEGLAPPMLSLNVSAHQLADPTFVERFAARAERAGIDPSQIELELTEGALFADGDRSHARLQMLHDHGFRIAVDDFGTGFSSLGYLQRLPLQRLKVDRSFVAGLPSSASDSAIVRAVVELAHGLGLDVVAEGVEDERQRRVVEALGCDAWQGYLATRPLSGEAFVAWLREREGGGAS